jgi:hypothetical protein
MVILKTMSKPLKLDAEERRLYPDLSEGPWGGGPPTLQAVHDRVLRPDSERTIVVTTRCTKGED